MKMVQSLVDPCLYYWKDTNGQVTLMAVVHVDDIILIGKKRLKSKNSRSRLGTIQYIGSWKIEEAPRSVV